MPVNHEAVAALPVATAADKALIRAMATRRFAYCLTAAELASNLTAVDPATGVVPLNLIQNNILFAYDSADATTLNDGVTCLVSADGKRFKSAVVTPPYSVLTKGTTAQPGSPAVGDTYLIPTAATGAAWTGKDGQIGIFTAAGWVFAISPIGRLLYVKDETANYHRNTSGVWTAGVGSIALGAGSITLTTVLGANASFVIKVENQTTNTPPGSPVTPTAYIIGSSPTGAWAGQPGKLAICLVAGAFTIITPVNGDTVYDKALNTSYTFNGAAWISTAGAWAKHASVYTQATGGTLSGASTYTYSTTTAPVFTTQNFADPSTLTYAAKAAGANLFVEYEVSLTSNSAGAHVIALFIDSIATAIGWDQVNLGVNGTMVRVRFKITAADTASHVYKIAVMYGAFAPSNLGHRLFEIEEESL